jgi:hypothetical protein
MVEQEGEEVLDCSGHDLDFILVVGAEVINVVTTPVAELVFSMLVSYALCHLQIALKNFIKSDVLSSSPLRRHHGEVARYHGFFSAHIFQLLKGDTLAILLIRVNTTVLQKLEEKVTPA